MQPNDQSNPFRDAGEKLRLRKEQEILAKAGANRRYATEESPCEFCGAADQRLLTDVDGMWECEECREKLLNEIYGRSD